MELLININLDSGQVERLVELGIYVMAGLLAVVLVVRPLIRAIATRGFGGGRRDRSKHDGASPSNSFPAAESLSSSASGDAALSSPGGGDGGSVSVPAGQAAPGSGMVRVSVVVPEAAADAIQKHAVALRGARDRLRPVSSPPPSPQPMPQPPLSAGASSAGAPSAGVSSASAPRTAQNGDQRPAAAPQPGGETRVL